MVISKTGTAQICDYGLGPIISNPTFTITATPGVVGTSRWLAPEIFDLPSEAGTESTAGSKPADVFAFAMLAVEVFTGEIPFGNMTNKMVSVEIAQGKRPAKPEAGEQLGLTTEIWKFVEKCWSQNPAERPTMDEVVRTWEGFVNGYVVFPLGLFIGRWITSRDNSRTHASERTERRTHFVESPNSFIEECGKSPRPLNPYDRVLNCRP